MKDVRCIRCGVPADVGDIGVDIGTGDITCHGCEESYSAADVRAFMAGWGEVLTWIEAHPATRKG